MKTIGGRTALADPGEEEKSDDSYEWEERPPQIKSRSPKISSIGLLSVPDKKADAGRYEVVRIASGLTKGSTAAVSIAGQTGAPRDNACESKKTVANKRVPCSEISIIER